MALIVLDRDGVINEDSDAYVKSLEEWIPIPGSIEAIARLSQAGHAVAIATNQSGLARGYFDLATLNAMHTKLCEAVVAAGGAIQFIAYCPHHPDDQCECRKPKTGLIDQIKHALSPNLTHSEGWMIGDSRRDLEAGRAAGLQVALVKTGKGMRTLAAQEGLANTLVFDNLASFVDAFLEGFND